MDKFYLKQNIDFLEKRSDLEIIDTFYAKIC